MSEKKKAMLVVAGGRGFPDVLAFLCVQPQLVGILTTNDGWQSETTFHEIVQTLPDCEEILPTLHVESYEFEDAKQACLNVCDPYPQTEWDWYFSIGSCPKILGIAAYEVAREMGIPCIQVDTKPEKIVSLIKDIGVPPQNLFHMSVDDYMNIYRRKHDPYKPDTIRYRKFVQQQQNLTKLLVDSKETCEFTSLARENQKHEFFDISTDLAQSRLVQQLENHYKAIDLQQKLDGKVQCSFTSKDFKNFLSTGQWLEVYVWQEVKNSDFADDCQWGYKIRSTAENELDVVLIYKAQLIFGECKTDRNPFKKKHSYLDDMNSKAEMLGRSYVTKVFVTNASQTLDGYANFEAQAKLRHIVVIAAEELSNIGAILKEQATTPTYPRI